jgi:DNA ligase-1
VARDRWAARAAVSVEALALALGGLHSLTAFAAEGAAEPAPGAPAARIETTRETEGPPALMLAEVYEPGIPMADYWASEKLDGVRAYWDGHRLISRGGHLIRTPPGFAAGFPAEPLDGELWMGRGRFEEVSGLARRLEPHAADWAEVRYLVFDLPADPAPFDARLARLHTLMQTAANPRLVAVEQFRIQDPVELAAGLRAIVAVGGEGLMLHRGASLYRAGRSADLLKVKAYQDAEALVVGHVPGKGKYRGMLGALEVRDDQGRRFRIGAGFTDAQRRDPPPVGSRITFRYRGRTELGIPRFASFLRLDPDMQDAPSAR